MTRRALFPAVVLLLLIGPIAGAAKRKPVKTVKVTVVIENASGSVAKDWALGVRLARRTRLAKAKGMKASGRTKAITLTPKAGRDLADGASRTVRVVVRGAKAPRKVTLAGTACTTGAKKRAGRTLKVRVTCRLKAPESSATPTPGPSSPGGEPTPSPAPGGETPSPSPSPSPAPGADATPYPVAPYVDMTLGAPSDAPDIAEARAATGAPATTLGFITAVGDTCQGGWDGRAATDTATPYATALASRLKAYTDAGGKLVLAFGGQAGSDLAQACGSAAATKTAYAEAIDAVSAQAGVPITHIDLDVEEERSRTTRTPSPARPRRWPRCRASAGWSSPTRCRRSRPASTTTSAAG